MTKYIQTNERGYVTGVVEEPLLVGLFGGTRTMEIPDEQAAMVKQLLSYFHSRGEGLHIDDVVEFKLPEE